jgi:hypothetical protein
MKILYVITVNKAQKVEETTDNEDGTKTVKTVDKLTPVEICLKLPSRRDREEISLVYNAQYGIALGKGLQTADVVKRSLLDSGGVITRQELERADEILKTFIQKKNELVAAEMEGADTTDLKQEIEDLTNEFTELERPQREIYSRTAEFYAESKSVEWCVLNMCYYKMDKDFYQVFDGPTTDGKLSNYYAMCDEPEKHMDKLDAYNKATLCYYHHILAGKTEKEYFDELINSSNV